MKHKIYWDADHYQHNKELPKMVQWIKPNSRVLEFGAAAGYMSRYLRDQLGCTVVGVELDEGMAAQAAQYCEQIVIANLDINCWEEEIVGSFDYILFGDVLEHLRTPEATLSKALKFLNPNGELLISVPNITHNAIIMLLTKGQFDYTEYGILDSTHVHFFTRQSLKAMMQRNGLACVGEQNSQYPPSISEFNQFYLCHPLLSFRLLFRKDAHVYQYINRWKLVSACSPSEIVSFKAQRLSFGKIVLALMDDLNNYFIFKTGKGLALPKSIKKIVRKK